MLKLDNYETFTTKPKLHNFLDKIAIICYNI